MSLTARLRPASDAEERSTRRRRLLLEGGLRHGPECFRESVIHDLSAGGFRAEAAIELSPGMVVELDLPAIGVREAKVMWAGWPYAGCAFLHPLNPQEVGALLALSPVVWGDFANIAGSARSRREAGSNVGEDQANEAAAYARIAPSLPFGRRLRVILVINLSLWVAILGFAAAVVGSH